MAAEGGGGDGGVGGGNEITAMSPRNRVKLLCSHGGKILPRPTDGVLKYVGGETRVVAFSREINFSELMQKLTSLSDADSVLKYQLIPEDLDALVSVKSDEDLRHMLDEYDRHHHQDDAAAADGSPRLRPFRAFLFPSSLLDLQFASTDSPHSPLDQRYIDAINGILRIPPPSPKPIFAVSSASTSPDHGGGHESPSPARRAFIHKVRSSPSLCSLNQLAADAHPVTVSPMFYQFPHHYHQNYQQYHHHRPPPQPQQDPGKGLPSSYYSPVRQHKGDHGGKRLDNRADTLPQDIGE